MFNTTPQSLIKFTLLLLAPLLLVLALISGAYAQAISRGYASDDNGLKPGMVVRLSANSTSEEPKVERASKDDLNQVIGVATTSDSSVVTIANGNQKVYVETTGEVDVYVSDINGEVKKGELLTISPLKGILAKADDYSNVVLGIALEDFISQSKESYTISTPEGDKTVQVALVRISLDRKANAQQSTPDSSLKRLGKSVSGKDVGEIRIVIALVIFFIVLVAEGGILYGAITSAIIAYGRNPLAKNIIRKELVRVVLIAIFVLSVGLGAVYGILWV